MTHTHFNSASLCALTVLALLVTFGAVSSTASAAELEPVAPQVAPAALAAPGPNVGASATPSTVDIERSDAAGPGAAPSSSEGAAAPLDSTALGAARPLGEPQEADAKKRLPPSAEVAKKPLPPSAEVAKKPLPPPGEGMVLLGFDDRGSIRVGVMTQLRATLIGSATTQASLDAQIRAARLYLQGHVLDPRVRYFFQAEFSPVAADAGVRLLDLEVNYQLAEAATFRFGQVRTPTSKQWVQPLWGQQFAQFSFVSDVYRAGRDLGLEVDGNILGQLASYQAGLFNGRGVNQPTRLDDEYLLAGRVEIHPWGPLGGFESPAPVGTGSGVGVGLLANRQQATQAAAVGGARFAQSTLGGDITFRLPRLYFTSEAYFRQVDLNAGATTRSGGGFVQAGYFLLPELLEAAVRGSYVTNLDDASSNASTGEATVNYYFMGNHLKLNAGYLVGDVRGAAVPAGTTLPAGLSHQGILQVQLML